MRVKTKTELAETNFIQKSSPHSGKLICSLSDKELEEDKVFNHHQMVDTIMKYHVFDSFEEELSLFHHLTDSYDGCEMLIKDMLYDLMHNEASLV